jgi:hypothetical protein
MVNRQKSSRFPDWMGMDQVDFQSNQQTAPYDAKSDWEVIMSPMPVADENISGKKLEPVAFHRFAGQPKTMAGF